MKLLSAITDPTYRPHSDNYYNRTLVGFLNDKRDLPFLRLTIQISLTLIPIGILLYIPFVKGAIWWVLAVVYFVLNNFWFKGPFGLMLHCTSHRKFFKEKYRFMNNYLPWVVGPFFGQTPETYYSHHIWMHHLENNLEEDRSSTIRYQRDNFRHFLHYFFDFFFFGIVRLINYFHSKNRKRQIFFTLTGELLFIAMCIVFSLFNFPATLVVFILPFLISRLVMMLGNWTQHAFVDQAEPGNSYKNSITCINTKYNHKCWNDGYHISHHERMGMHYTDHPEHFKKHLDLYAANRAIIFSGIGFLTVFWYLMKKDYATLAKHALNLNNTFISEQDFIDLMKYRLSPVKTS